MRFYYENHLGDSGYFSENNLIKAIYTVWNIDANLYLLKENVKKIDKSKPIFQSAKLIFAPLEDSEFNTDLLKEYGYKMEDGEEYREIIDVKTGKVVKYDWSEVKQLI